MVGISQREANPEDCLSLS